MAMQLGKRSSKFEAREGVSRVWNRNLNGTIQFSLKLRLFLQWCCWSRWKLLVPSLCNNWKVRTYASLKTKFHFSGMLIRIWRLNCRGQIRRQRTVKSAFCCLMPTFQVRLTPKSRWLIPKAPSVGLTRPIISRLLGKKRRITPWKLWFIITVRGQSRRLMTPPRTSTITQKSRR